MKKNLTLICATVIFSGPGVAHTLKDSFEAAKLNMESIQRADAVVNQSEELKTQARAAILPVVSGVGSYTKIDPPSGAGASPFLLTRQYTAGLRLSQPLLRGGSLAAYKLAKENVLLAQFQKDATEINLYQLVINSYYSLQIAQVDTKNIEELLKHSRERVNEIRERTRIGRSRRGELIEAEAQLLTAESQFQQSLMSLQQAERNFEFFTKLKPQEIKVSSEIPKAKDSLSIYLMSLKTRPDIMANYQQSKVAQQQIEIQKGSHYPSLDLVSNYYIDRTGVLASSKWDVGVAMVIPLYQGGGVDAAVRGAVEEKRIAELRSTEALRTAERDVTINYQNLVQITEQIRVIKTALAKSEEAYRLNKKDYQLGLVTNLDVLQSLNGFIETKRSFYNLISMAHLYYKNLEASTGVLP